MKMTNCKKSWSLILCVVLIAAMALVTCGCSNNSTQWTTIVVKDGDTVGEGSTEFPLVITDQSGNETKVTVKTNQKTVGGALLEIKLIAGEMAEYGLYMKAVNGIVADYEKNQTYWAFYINGEYAMTGVDTTDIAADTTYSLKIEK